MRILISLIAMLLLTAGCAGTGKPFVEVTNIPQNKGVVYIYMPKKGNIAQAVNIKVDNAEGIGIRLGKLKKNHHFTYIAPVGENLFRIGNSAVSINVENGQSYFISMKSYKFFFSLKFKPFSVEPTAGFQQIRTTQPQVTTLY